MSKAEISSFIKGVTDGSWTDCQVAALLMAIYLKGFDAKEQFFITKAMFDSGDVLDFSDIEKPKADKHSTGRVGDKTSLIVAPLAAACEIAVPMISGRSLGHTGGTLDKLESIDGYNVNLTTKKFKQITKDCGYAMTGQTENLVPADKKLYALRDETATVSSIPLIVSSVMSKKIDEGSDALVLDVKTGNGAFAQKIQDAKRLAKEMISIGNACGLKTQALITDMNQPLGKYVGNALEVYECVKVLRNEIDESIKPTVDVSLDITSRMLVMTNIESSFDDAKLKLNKILESGQALEKFRQNLELQGGSPKICDKPETLLSKEIFNCKIKADKSGFVTHIRTTEIGNAISEIGGGRMKLEDSIDPDVGYCCHAKLGDKMNFGSTLGILLCRNESQSTLVYEKLQKAYKIEDKMPKKFELIKGCVT